MVSKPLLLTFQLITLIIYSDLISDGEEEADNEEEKVEDEVCNVP